MCMHVSKQRAWMICNHIGYLRSLMSCWERESVCKCMYVCLVVWGAHWLGLMWLSHPQICVMGWEVTMQGDCSGSVTCFSFSLFLCVVTWHLCSENQNTEFPGAQDSKPRRGISLCWWCPKYVCVIYFILDLWVVCVNKVIHTWLY